MGIRDWVVVASVTGMTLKEWITYDIVKQSIIANATAEYIREQKKANAELVKEMQQLGASNAGHQSAFRGMTMPNIGLS